MEEDDINGGGNGNTDSSFRKDWSSLLKPRRSLDYKLSKEGSFSKFLENGAEDGGVTCTDGDSMAPQASVVGFGPLTVPAHRSGRLSPDSMVAQAPPTMVSPVKKTTTSVTSSSSSAEADSMVPQASLPPRNRIPRPPVVPVTSSFSTTTTTPSTCSASSPIPQWLSQSEGESSKNTTAHSSMLHGSDASLSFFDPAFDPNGSRTSFFQDDQEPTEAEDLEGSFQHLATTPDGFPVVPSSGRSSRQRRSSDNAAKAGFDADFGSFRSLEEDVKKHFLSPPATKPQSYHIRAVENDSDRSRSRRSLPNLPLHQSGPSSEEFSSPIGRSSVDSLGASQDETVIRSGRGSKRPSGSSRNKLRTSSPSSPAHGGGAPLPFSPRIDLDKAQGAAREKSKSLRDHRSTIRCQSMRRHGVARTKSIEDRATINGILDDFLMEQKDDLGLDTVDAKQSSKSRPSKSRTKSNSSDLVNAASRSKDQGIDSPTKTPTITKEDGSTASREGLLNDVGFPDPYIASPTASSSPRKKHGVSPEGSARSSRSSRDRHRSKDSPKATSTSGRSPRTADSPESRSTDRPRARSKSRSRRTLGSRSLSKKHLDGSGDEGAPMAPPYSPGTPQSTLSKDTSQGSTPRSSRSHRHRRRISKEPEDADKDRGTVEKSSRTRTSHSIKPSSLPFDDLNDIKDDVFGFPNSLSNKRSESPRKRESNNILDNPKKFSVRELASVEPTIIKTRSESPKKKPLRHPTAGLSQQQKEEPLDHSGHTTYTTSTNWNWEDDHWEAPTNIVTPATIQEEDNDDDEDNNHANVHDIRNGHLNRRTTGGFGSHNNNNDNVVDDDDTTAFIASPLRRTHKTLEIDPSKSAFTSPVVHNKKKISAWELREQEKHSPPPKKGELGNFLRTPSNWMLSSPAAPPLEEPSVASAPVDDKSSGFSGMSNNSHSSSSKEIQRSTSLGRPPRPSFGNGFSERSNSRSNIYKSSTESTSRHAILSHSLEQFKQQQQQHSTRSSPGKNLQSPRGVADPFDPEEIPSAFRTTPTTTFTSPTGKPSSFASLSSAATSSSATSSSSLSAAAAAASPSPRGKRGVASKSASLSLREHQRKNAIRSALFSTME